MGRFASKWLPRGVDLTDIRWNSKASGVREATRQSAGRELASGDSARCSRRLFHHVCPDADPSISALKSCSLAPSRPLRVARLRPKRCELSLVIDSIRLILTYWYVFESKFSVRLFCICICICTPTPRVPILLSARAEAAAHAALCLSRRARRQDGAVRRLGDARAVSGGRAEGALSHALGAAGNRRFFVCESHGTFLQRQANQTTQANFETETNHLNCSSTRVYTHFDAFAV
jgi:hypothetical protein